MTFQTHLHGDKVMGLHINWRYFSCDGPFSNGVSGVSSIFCLFIGYSNRTFFFTCFGFQAKAMQNLTSAAGTLVFASEKILL